MHKAFTLRVSKYRRPRNLWLPIRGSAG